MKTEHKRTQLDTEVLKALQFIADILVIHITPSEHVTESELLAMYRKGSLSWIFNQDPEELARRAVLAVNNRPVTGLLENEETKLHASALKNTVFIQYKGYKASFAVESIFGILEDFEKSTRITKEPWERKEANRQLPEPFSKKEWLSVAELYNNAEEIMKDEQHLEVLSNLSQALAEPEKHPDGTSTKRDQKIALWTDHAKWWNDLYQHALTLDYELIIERRKQAELDRLAEENKAIQTLLKKGKGADEFEYLSARRVFDLFAKFNKEPKSDMELFLSLYYTDQLPEETTLDKHVEYLKNKLEARTEAFNKKYMKKAGGYKAIHGSRAYALRNDEQGRLRRDEDEIKMFIKYRPEILKLLENVKAPA